MTAQQGPLILRPALLAILLLLPQTGFAIEIIAHRGYSCGDEENTLESVARAWQAGADAVELDVRISADGAVYLFHDDELNGEPVSRRTFEELQRNTAYLLPLLATVLELDAPSGSLLLDLKDEQSSNFEPLVELIDSSGFPRDRIMIQSSDIGVLGKLQLELPTVQFYYLSRLERRPPFFLKPKPSSIIAAIDGHHFSGVSLKGRKFLGPQFINAFQEAGYRVNVWTINDLSRAAHYEKSGVDGIITDKLAELAAGKSLCTTAGSS